MGASARKSAGGLASHHADLPSGQRPSRRHPGWGIATKSWALPLFQPGQPPGMPAAQRPGGSKRGPGQRLASPTLAAKRLDVVVEDLQPPGNGDPGQFHDTPAGGLGVGRLGLGRRVRAQPLRARAPSPRAITRSTCRATNGLQGTMSGAALSSGAGSPMMAGVAAITIQAGSPGAHRFCGENRPCASAKGA